MTVQAAGARSNDGRTIETSTLKSSVVLSVGVGDPSKYTIDDLAADRMFEENLEIAIAEALNVDP